MQWWHEGICITDDRDRVDLDVVHPFLAGSYWSPGIPRDVVARAVQHSLCLSALDDEAQVGFARVVTDRATFAYLADVFVLPSHRGRGLGRQLAHVAVTHPEVAGVRKFLLATLDAHGVYEPVGFKPIPDPHLLMGITRRPEDLYGTDGNLA